MTAEERARKLVMALPLDADAMNPEVLRDVYTVVAAAIRAAEDAATLKERERLATILLKEADLYEKNGQPSVLGFLWGWRDSAKIYRKMAEQFTSPAPTAPGPAPSQTSEPTG